MFILFEDDDDDKYIMVEKWNQMLEAGHNPYGMTHHELAKMSKFSSEDWKEFLTDPLVAEDIEKDMLLVQKQQLNQLLYSVTDNSKSVGLPAIINQLTKNIEEKGNKKEEGPRYIYTFVPLNPEEENAPNVQKLDKNIFKVD